MTTASVIYVILFAFILETVISDKHRNVVILLADDGGFELGAYGNKICQTPNIDALARRGLLFDRAFASASSCSPSRAALLTGAPQHATGMYGLHHGVHHFSAFSNISSLPAVLRAHGVATGIIGKKHVGPANEFRFDFEQTEENNPINQVGRNITRIKLLVRDFLKQANEQNKRFLLYVGFHDPHRCGREEMALLGAFCERFGSGEPGAGLIPDWTPWYYQWDEVELPYHVQDTEAARRDIAAQYTTMSRLDQGVALVLREVSAAGHADDTLVVYTSDNGIPFAGGRTNLYEGGVREPLIVASPEPTARRNEVSHALVSHLDLMPTVLDWFGIVTDQETNEVLDTDRPKSLLPILEKEPTPTENEAVFASQSLHEVTMYYPMRAVRTRRYKLVHNLAPRAPFPIDQDLYRSPTFQDILNRTINKQPLPWYRTLDNYYHRSQWELYDLVADPAETNNLHGKPSLVTVERGLRLRLARWQRDTRDPWRCAPAAVLEGDACLPLYNGLDQL